jgi:hypothetical protein
MSNRSPALAIAAASVIGATLWFAVSVLTGKREAWDASAYWVVAYPVALMACAFLGYRYPERPWRWALVLFEAQFLAMCVRNGELGSGWPLGIVLFAVIALPGVLSAKLGSKRASGC